MNSRIKKFFSYYKPYRGLFLTVMACAVVVAALSLLPPLFTRIITKEILENNLPDALGQIYRVGAMMLLFILVQNLFNFFVDYRGHAMGAMMERDMRGELFDHYQKLSFGFYDEQKTGQLMSRITNDLLLLTELYHHGPEDLVIYLVKFIGAFVILVQINAKLTLIVFLFLPFLALFILYFNKKLRFALKRNKERIGDVNAQVEDSLAGIRVVKSFANEETEEKKFGYENNRFLESRKNGYKCEAYFFNGAEIFTQTISAAVVVFGGIAITNASLDLADLLTFLLYIGNFIEPIRKLTHITQQYQEGFTGFERFMEIMEIEPEIQNAPNAVVPGRLHGDIRFDHVGFQYRENYDYVLRDISLDVKAGEYVALVGASGVGKTTLCSLIPRFYETTEGSLLLDGTDIRQFDLHGLRQNIGVVQQDVYLFSGTVLDNIRYGKPGASREEIIEAARRANAHDFIMGLPEGYDTDIGQRGVKLSGGQKQRLSIARVFLKDPPILIFDEATSSLDNESERVVQSSLENLAEHRTTLVIAHRLSTIRNAQRILVLNQSGIEEEGTHGELMAKEGTYARLYQMQFEV